MTLAIAFPAEESANALNNMVLFPADVGGKPVECRISLATLLTVYRARSGLMMDGFREHRAAIEDVARRLILAGGVKDGVLTISDNDAQRG